MTSWLTPSTHTPPRRFAHPIEPSPVSQFFGVVANAQSYRNLLYLLLGLPLGTLWFSVLVTAVSVSVSMLVVALLGIPMLVGTWHLTRAIANVERGVANTLLGERMRFVAITRVPGNRWAHLRAMTRDRARWRELEFVLLRFPLGIATFTAAVTAIGAPTACAAAPFEARFGGDEPFGDWRYSSTMEDIANSAWAWLFIPGAAVLVVAALHLTNLLAQACGRFANRWLGASTSATNT